MRALRLLVAILVVLVVTFIGLAGSFGMGRGLDAVRQLRRVAALRDADADPAVLAQDLRIPGATPWNRIQVVATHNSYHLRAGPLQYFLIGMAKPGEPAKLRYEHEPLYDQLNHGIRSVELDVRSRGRRFIVSHVPMVDNRATCPDFRLALEEIRIWSRLHPEHVPVTVLLELKDDWRFLDPRLGAWDAEALERLDQAIRGVFPAEGLLTPPQTAAAWPTLDQVRGRVAFILHVDPRITPLYHGATLWVSGSGQTAARVQIVNDPVTELSTLRECLERGELVRTRADADLVRDPARRVAALGSGAQIVSTDYPTEVASGGVTIRVLPPPVRPREP